MAALVHGAAEPPFSSVADVFADNVSTRGERGAAICVYHRGRKVVDLWGGVRNRNGAPFASDTMLPLYSTSKGVAAATCAIAVSRGLFDYDDAIARHWPAFAQHGKDRITIRQLLDHAAGLALFGRVMRRDDLADPDLVAGALEQMRPLWPSGERCGYHVGTFGPLVSELIRRTDPQRRPLARFFADEIANPLGLAFSFGLPADMDDQRRARIVRPSWMQVFDGIARAPFGLRYETFNPLSRLHQAARELPDLHMNDRRWLGLEFPSANGIGEVRAVARLYDALLHGGPGVRLSAQVRADLAAPPSPPAGGCRDMVMGIESLWHLGFLRPSASFDFSPSPQAFGMPGLGGSFGFADPEHALAYAYAPTRLGLLAFDDPRELALRKAVYQALGQPPRGG